MSVHPAAPVSPDWPALSANVAGNVVAPDHARYDEARHGLERDDRPPSGGDRRARRPTPTWPRPSGFAREHGLEIAVRGGGHNAAGLATIDDGLVIDLAEMNQVRGRSRAADRPRRRRRDLGRLRRRDAGARAGRHRRGDLDDRRRPGSPSAAGWAT